MTGTEGDKGRALMLQRMEADQLRTNIKDLCDKLMANLRERETPDSQHCQVIGGIKTDACKVADTSLQEVADKLTTLIAQLKRQGIVDQKFFE